MSKTSDTPFKIRRKPVPSVSLPSHATYKPISTPQQSHQEDTESVQTGHQLEPRGSRPNALHRDLRSWIVCNKHVYPATPGYSSADQEPSHGQTLAASDGRGRSDTSSTKPFKFQIDQAGLEKTWTPVWLHWAVLLAFAALFLCLLVGLVLLYTISRKHHGISTQISSNHYYWTYGPTAILMLVVALWRQVDYNCRRLIPWEQVDLATDTGDQNALLDYISPFLLTSLVGAIRLRHWCVVASLTGFLLLKLITIFSTGLLVLESTQLLDNNLTLPIPSPLSSEAHCDTGSASCRFSDLTVNPVLNYYAIASNRLAFPEGTTSNSMFEVPELPAETPPGAIITTTVSGFYPVMDCEVATSYNDSGLPPRDNFTGFYAGQDVMAISYRIYGRGRMWDANYSMITFCNPSIVRCPPRAVTAWDNGYIWSSYNGASVSNLPMLLTVTDVRYSQIIAHTLNASALNNTNAINPTINVTDWSINVASTATVLCMPRYSIEDTRLQMEPAQRGTDRFLRVSGPLTHSGKHLHNYTDGVLQGDIYTLQEAVYQAQPGGIPTMFDFMSKLKAVSNDTSYLDPDVLASVATKAFDMLASQMAAQVLTGNTTAYRNAAMTYSENRLHVKPLSFWLMAVGFILMLGVTAIVFLSRPKPRLAYDPGPLANYACMLAQHAGHNRQSFSDKLTLSTKTKKCSSQSIQDSQETKSSPSQHSLQRDKVDSGQPTVSDRANSQVSTRSWEPLAANRLFQLLSVGTACAMIAVLAILQRISDGNDGITDVDISTSVAHSLYTYIPAATMLLLATLSSSTYFAITTMAPYHYMTVGNGTARRSLLLDICGKAPSQVLYTSSRRLLTAPILISIAVVLSAFLTIVVSGLYSLIAVPVLRSTTIDQLGYFDYNWNVSAGDNNAMSVLNLLEHSNATYPELTYQELAIPLLSRSQQLLSELSVMDYSGDIQIRVSAPVVRASLNCTALPKGAFRSIQNAYNNLGTCDQLACGLGTAGNEQNSTFVANATAGPYCSLPGMGTAEQPVRFVFQMQYPPSGYTGRLASVSNCPSLSYTLGYFSTDMSKNYGHQDTTDYDNVTSLVCSQYIEESDTDIHLVLPSLTLDSSKPPTFNESNSRVVSTRQYDITSFLGQLSNYPSYGYGQPSVYDGVPMPIDTFTQIVLSGLSGIPAEELIHPNQVERLIDAVQHVYRLYMAQAMNSNMRRNFTSASAASAKQGHAKTISPVSKSLKATFIDPTRIRIVQNKASAIVLMTLIGLILLLSIAACSTIRMKSILEHNPCSIAGAMSLLERSQLVKLLPEDADAWDEKKREKVFEAWRYSLGWWDGDKRLLTKPVQQDGEVQRQMRFGIDIETGFGDSRDEHSMRDEPSRHSNDDDWHASWGERPLLVLPPVRPVSPIEGVP